jgi:hypothetical protein
LSASDIADNVSASCHIAIDGLAFRDINDVVEEVCLSMLTSKVLYGSKRESRVSSGPFLIGAGKVKVSG